VLVATWHLQPAARQSANDLPLAEVQTSETSRQNLLLVSYGSVEQFPSLRMATCAFTLNTKHLAL
jgi:hypothetical protein